MGASLEVIAFPELAGTAVLVWIGLGPGPPFRGLIGDRVGPVQQTLRLGPVEIDASLLDQEAGVLGSDESAASDLAEDRDADAGAMTIRLEIVDAFPVFLRFVRAHFAVGGIFEMLGAEVDKGLEIAYCTAVIDGQSAALPLYFGVMDGDII